MMQLRQLGIAALGITMALAAAPTLAQKKYDAGADDTQIKVGHSGPATGPASAYGAVGKAIGAYFDKVNAEGGINGRKIRFISLDDGYSPAKTVEHTRKLVEEDEVLLIFQSVGTASNSAVHRYMNTKKVPQLFVASGATKWGDAKGFPYTMGWQPSYQSEARLYAAHILQSRPGARIGVLYQNDDYGMDYLKGLEEGLGDKAARMIVSKQGYEVTDASLDNQLAALKASGADTFVNITTPKFAAQAISTAARLGWKPLHYLNSVSTAVGAVMTAGGLQHGVGIISAGYLKDPTDPRFHNSKEVADWLAWMKKYHPSGDVRDNFNVYGYTVAQTLVHVLRQAGDQLTRDNVMKQAASLDLSLPMLLPGVNVKTAADDFYPIERQQLMRFDGKSWQTFGNVLGR